MFHQHKAAIALIVLMRLISAARAEASLPLEGYFRPGRCMPVAVDAAVPLSAERSVATDVASGRSGVVAMLMLASSDSLRAGDRDIPLHPLTSTQRLVGTTINNENLAAKLFPSQTVIKIDLQPVHPLPGPALAWEALDAVIVDGKIDPALVRNLLGDGTIVAVRSRDRPDSRWAWKQDGEFWIVRSQVVGPDEAIGGDAAYLPMQSWRFERPAELRERIVIVSVLVCLLMLATLLVRARWTIAAMLTVALLCGAALELWRRGQPVIQMASGAIIVDSNQRQIDEWRYFTSAHGAAGEADGASRPILLDSQQAARMNLRLQCDADGSDHWRFTLPAGGELAFLTRRIEPAMPMLTIRNESRSPLNELARQMYLDAQSKILGETDAADNSWPTVVIGRR